MRGESSAERGKRSYPTESARSGLRQLIESGDPQTVAIINGAMEAVARRGRDPSRRKPLASRLAKLDAEEVMHIYMVHQRLAARMGDGPRA